MTGAFLDVAVLAAGPLAKAGFLGAAQMWCSKNSAPEIAGSFGNVPYSVSLARRSSEV